MELNISSLMHISAAGMKAETGRMRIIAENMANANTTGLTPGADPYRRKVAVFKEELNKELGIKLVGNVQPMFDNSDFQTRFDPSHPAADATTGYVKTPNVKPIMEMVDMKQAQRSYEANLSMVEVTKAMISQTIDLLRA